MKADLHFPEMCSFYYLYSSLIGKRAPEIELIKYPPLEGIFFFSPLLIFAFIFLLPLLSFKVQIATVFCFKSMVKIIYLGEGTKVIQHIL